MYGVPMPVQTSLRKAVPIFHALSDETRVSLLEQLKNGERCVCELTDVMKAGQSRLSFHLKVLKEAGLLVDRREGRWIYYSINPEAIGQLEDIVDALKHAARSAMSAGRCC
jgi:ArsR family transcriptional regulator